MRGDFVVEEEAAGRHLGGAVEGVVDGAMGRGFAGDFGGYRGGFAALLPFGGEEAAETV